MARRGWIFDSSSDACEDEEGSTSLTPESAGLGGSEPEIERKSLKDAKEKIHVA